MKNKKLIFHSILSLGIIIFQAYSPVIYLGFVTISIDITLVYLSIMAILFDRFSIIFLGFFIGLAQDLISQVSLFGLFSFIKSLSSYLIGSIRLHESVWDKKIKYLVVLATYFIHFFLYFYVVINNKTSIYMVLKYSTLQTFFTFCIFLILNTFIFRRKLI